MREVREMMIRSGMVLVRSHIHTRIHTYVVTHACEHSEAEHTQAFAPSNPHTLPRYILGVRATDADGLTKDDSVAVQVLDVNEPPRFTTLPLLLTLPASTPPNTLVYTIPAVDDDDHAAPNGWGLLAYEWSGFGGSFVLDGRTGAVTTSGAPTLAVDARFVGPVVVQDGAGLQV